MFKKALIIGLILCSFLVLSASTVIASDKILKDRTGDVTDYFGEIVTSSKNINISDIDIVEVTYSKQGQTITLTLKLKRSIQNKGSIEDINYEEDIDTIGAIDAVIYELYLTTSEDYYYVAYVNNEIIVTNETENISDSDFSIIEGGSTLKVTFNALHDDETYEEIGATASYIKMPDLSNDFEESDYELLFDSVPDEYSLSVVIDGQSAGKVGENIDLTSEVSGGSTPYAYAWDFGDGKTSDAENPAHRYTKAGTYTVTLTVTDDYGNQESDSLTITISEDGTSNQGDSNNAILLFAAIIVIIVIIGVVVLVLIIRR